MSSTRGIERSHFTSYSGSIDPDHYSEQKKREIYTDWPGPFHSIGEGRFTQIDRSVRIDRSIPCRGKNPKSIFLVLYDYIRIDSHLIWTDQAWFQLFKLDFSGMKPIISHSRIKGDKIKFSPKFINPNSLNFTLIWTIIWPNPYDFVSFLRIYHSLVRSAKVWNSISASF